MRVSTLILFDSFQLQKNKFIPHEINVKLQQNVPSGTNGQEKNKD